MQQLLAIVALAALSGAFGCDARAPVRFAKSSAESEDPLVIQLLLAKASSDSSPIVTAPGVAGTKWLIVAPYCLEESWSSLDLGLSDSAKGQLVDWNIGEENVMVARIENGRVASITHMGIDFEVRPMAIVCDAGESVALSRKPNSRYRPLVITPAMSLP